MESSKQRQSMAVGCTGFRIFAAQYTTMSEIKTPTVVIGTRGSRLALWQANYVLDRLTALGVEARLEIIKTQGDKIQHLGFDKLEGKGFFTKEIEDSLLRGDVDLAVHSMKDLPTSQPDGLCITAVSSRANPTDSLIIRQEVIDQGATLRLPPNAVVGTSSARRKAQMLHLRPDVQLKDIRGNVPTRIKKLQEGQFDAILLASAGLERLQLEPEGVQVIRLHPREFVPAPAQGVLALQTCKDNLPIRRMLRHIHQSDVAILTNVERRLLQKMEGGCHIPLGAYCERDQMGNYHAYAAYAKSWDAPLVSINISSSTHFNLADDLYDRLQAQI
ncbi:MAG: hydroxymethylbilane synthase [Bacteroidota bacterium]